MPKTRSSNIHALTDTQVAPLNVPAPVQKRWTTSTKITLSRLSGVPPLPPPQHHHSSSSAAAACSLPQHPSLLLLPPAAAAAAAAARPGIISSSMPKREGGSPRIRSARR
ncbi:hypothetical protein ABVT39_016664, partial [Epinephelus coioides]